MKKKNKVERKQLMLVRLYYYCMDRRAYVKQFDSELNCAVIIDKFGDPVKLKYESGFWVQRKKS